MYSLKSYYQLPVNLIYFLELAKKIKYPFNIEYFLSVCYSNCSYTEYENVRKNYLF